MSDIFLSYASADQPTAQILANAIEQYGWSVWWDRCIPPGKTFDGVIEEEIRKARCVIVLWSRESASSDWVKTEAAEGQRRGILVPALIEDVEVPFAFKRIEAARLADWLAQDCRSTDPEFIELVAAVRDVISRTGAEQPTQLAVTHLASDKKLVGTRKDTDETTTQRLQSGSRQRVSSWAGLSLILAVTAAIVAYATWTWIPRQQSGHAVGNGKLHTPEPKPSNTSESTSKTSDASATPAETKRRIVGHILFDGKSIAKISDAYAILTNFHWPDERKDAPGALFSYDNQTGEFSLVNVPTGKLNFALYIDAGHPFKRQSPGDFVGTWSSENRPLEIGPHQTTIQYDYNVHALIRLTQPVDSGEMKDWDSEVLEFYDTYYGPRGDVFRWKHVPGVGRYAVSLALCVGEIHSHRVEKMLFSHVYYVTDSQFKVKDHYNQATLPVTAENEYYIMNIIPLNAKGKHVGELAWLEADGYNRGQFRFKIKSRKTGR